MGGLIAPLGIQRRGHLDRAEGMCLPPLVPGGDHSLTRVPNHRICPGNYFALRPLFLDIARTLAVFDILPPVIGRLEAKHRESTVW